MKKTVLRHERKDGFDMSRVRRELEQGGRMFVSTVDYKTGEIEEHWESLNV